MMSNKRVKREAKQLFHLCLVNGLLDEDRVRQVVGRVIAAGYRDGPALLAHFVRLVRLERTKHTARVESANPLPADLRTVAESSLARLYGPGVTTAFVHSPALIGGMRIQVGSDLYDGSVLARLRALEKNF
jgi:F-type H+-transporting ATPase subunit delta